MAAVSSRYARALADAVTGGKIAADAAAVEQQLHDLAALMRENADLRNVLISPAVATAKKKSVVAALGGKLGFSTPAQNFVFVLVDHKRIALFLQERETHSPLLRSANRWHTLNQWPNVCFMSDDPISDELIIMII